MKILQITFILLFFLFTFACSKYETPINKQSANITEIKNSNVNQEDQIEIPKSWKKIEECGLSFYLPSNFYEIKFQPFDSCAKSYRNNDIYISLDLFPGDNKESDIRKNEYSNEKEFQIVEKQIDKMKAELITYFGESDFPERKDLSFGAVLFVPVIDKNGDNLTVWTYSRSIENRETAKKIFETIKFEK